jgi:hypothetical protein
MNKNITTIKSSIFLCGVVKQCAPFLPQILHYMEMIGALFSDYKIIISFDHPSNPAWRDDSLDILVSYANQHPNKMILYINDLPLSSIRTINIAAARNRCLQIIRKFRENNGFMAEYFVMMDCDEVNAIKEIKTDILVKYFESKEYAGKWDALSFNRHPYYDLWALSIGPLAFSKMHFHQGEYYWAFKIGEEIEKAKKTSDKVKLIECWSAFNGFSIYRMEKFADCWYDGRVRLDLIPTSYLVKNVRICGPIKKQGLPEKGDCEHRSFHYQAIRRHKAKIRISPEILFN